ncbi:MAG TPA: hypothetical protein DCQ92_05400 [Verrucomicrobia subdivision 3 bacterium]|nr:hypothetical protein [Limisphaerales bacterium]
MKKTLLALVLVMMNFRLLQAQGTFQNLDFESAQLVFIDSPTNHLIATTSALPGWSAFSGTNQLAHVRYGIGGIVPPVWLSSQTNTGAINGSFSVGIGEITGLYTGSISQTALVPADAQSLLFKSGTGISGESLTVSLGGQDLSYIAISNALNYTLYGADISSFAGHTETLTFMGGSGGTLLDDIQFSQIAVPEPSAISLIWLGSGVLFYVRKRRRVWL